VLGVAALMMLMGFWLAENGGVHVTVNGEPVEGLAAALAGVLVIVALALLGTSMILMGVLACVLLVMLMAFAPFLLPGVLVALGLIWWWRRKGAKPAANVEGK